MRKTVDARGLSIAEPVMLTKKALEQEEVDEVLTIVDNYIAMESISKLSEKMNCSSSVDERGDSYFINISKNETSDDIHLTNSFQGITVIMFTSNVLGSGDHGLGDVLMKGFIYSLTQMEGAIRSLVFINSAVLLTTEGSEVLNLLKSLEDRGIEILSSATCLEYYKLTGKVKVGTTTNIFTITERIIETQRLVTL